MATSHKRETARRTPRAAVMAGSLAIWATAGVVGLGVINAPAPDRSDDLVALDQTDQAAEADTVDESRAAGAASAAVRSLPTLSRGGGIKRNERVAKIDRLVDPAATAQAVAAAKERLWTTADLNLWDRPDDSAEQLGVIEEGERVRVTGRSFDDRVEIVVEGQSRWVTAGYLSSEEPPKLGGECTNGTSVASGVSDNIKMVHAATCANFPEISVYGTLRGGGGDHPLGKAVDIMVSGERGWEVARFLRENYAALGISYIIYSQKIWSVERSGEGWRGMSDRGSATANHYDHVHVSSF